MTHIQGGTPPLIYTQPSGLTSTWAVKYTVTLQTPHTHAHKHISNIMGGGAVLNVQPFLPTRISCLPSITSWAQIARSSGYSRSTVLRGMPSAVPRIISRTLWDVDSTLQWCCHAAYVFPCTRDAIFFRLRRWIQQRAVWAAQAYASWCMPHADACSEFCADWCYDFPVLSSPTPAQDPSTSIRAGPRPPGGGSPFRRVQRELSTGGDPGQDPTPKGEGGGGLQPRQQPAHPQYANYWAPLTPKRHIPPHSAQPQDTNYWAPRTRTRKRHQQEHRPQQLTERSDPTQHAKGRTGDCPGPRKGTTTRRNVTQGGLQPPKQSHTPRGHTLAGGGPRGTQWVNDSRTQ